MGERLLSAAWRVDSRRHVKGLLSLRARCVVIGDRSLHQLQPLNVVTCHQLLEPPLLLVEIDLVYRRLGENLVFEHILFLVQEVVRVRSHEQVALGVDTVLEVGGLRSSCCRVLALFHDFCN